MPLSPLRTNYVDNVDVWPASTTAGTDGANATNYHVNQSAKKIDNETITGNWTFGGTISCTNSATLNGPLTTFTGSNAPTGTWRIVATGGAGSTDLTTMQPIATISVAASAITESIMAQVMWGTRLASTGGTVNLRFAISAGTSSAAASLTSSVKGDGILKFLKNTNAANMILFRDTFMGQYNYSPTLLERTAGFSVVFFGYVDKGSGAGTGSEIVNIGIDNSYVFGR